MAGSKAGRPNQRHRTRKDLLEAAARLIAAGGRPNLEEVAQAALVSRATAYRYFPSMDALLLEASLDVVVPQHAELFGKDAPADPVARVERVDDALHDMILANEPALRMMLVHSLQRPAGDGRGEDVPARQNRRTPLIEAALEPAFAEFEPRAMANLARSLALIIGTEAMVVCKDVLQLDDPTAREVKRWAIRALVEAAARAGR